MRILAKKLTAFLLSGMMAIGSVSGSVFAAETKVFQTKTSEISEAFPEEVSDNAEASAGPENMSMTVLGVDENTTTASENSTVEEAEENRSEDLNIALEEVENPMEDNETVSCKVTLDANGGYFVNEWDDVLNEVIDETDILNKIIPAGDIVTTVPVIDESIPMIFMGWSLERNGEILSQEMERHSLSEDCILYAVWEYEHSSYDISRNTDDGSDHIFDSTVSDEDIADNKTTIPLDDMSEDVSEEPLGVPSEEELQEVINSGEKDSLETDNEEVIVNETEVNDEENDVLTTYTVTLDANGGYFENEFDDVLGDYVSRAIILKKVIPAGGGISVTPLHDDIAWTFLGWSLERDGDLVSQEEKEYIPEDSCTLYAKWDMGLQTVTSNISSDSEVLLKNKDSKEKKEVDSENVKNQKRAKENPTDRENTLLCKASVEEAVDTQVSNASVNGLGVVYRTKKEIKEFIKGNPFSFESDSFTKQPSIIAPYRKGELSIDTQINAINALNQVRYIAGIDADVRLDADYASLAQAAALVNAANGELSHNPECPEKMNRDIYDQGFKGASSSNLAYGTDSIAEAVFLWMSDSDSSNIERVGHRRWLLNPQMQKTGFGKADIFSTVYAFDRSREDGTSPYVAWPAQTMPLEYFNNDDAWSVSLGRSIPITDVSVLLYRQRDGKKWIFSSEKSDGYFNVNNTRFGQPGCIIFRPNNVSYRNGDTFDITVTIGQEEVIQYSVEFFSINKALQTITVKAAPSILVGKTTNVNVSGAKETKEYIYTTSDEYVATVSASGKVRGLNAGTAIITVSTPETSGYKVSTKNIKIRVKAVPKKKPGNCHFVKWTNAKYSSCQIAWNKVADADGYQTIQSWTDGSHITRKTLKANALSQKCSVSINHVSQFKVRAFINIENGRLYSPWSDVCYITPSPTKLRYKKAGTSNNLKANISWNIIHGSNGYNVFLTTDPNGTWYWNQSTSSKAEAYKATITRYRGEKLKKGIRYYARVVSRRKKNGVFCAVPLPNQKTNIGSFVIK